MSLSYSKLAYPANKAGEGVGWKSQVGFICWGLLKLPDSDSASTHFVIFFLVLLWCPNYHCSAFNCHCSVVLFRMIRAWDRMSCLCKAPSGITLLEESISTAVHFNPSAKLHLLLPWLCLRVGMWHYCKNQGLLLVNKNTCAPSFSDI